MPNHSVIQQKHALIGKPQVQDYMANSQTSQRRDQVFLLMFGWVVCDSLISYSLASWFSLDIPVNAMLPMLVIFIGLVYGIRFISLPLSVLILIQILIIGLFVGIAIIPEFGLLRVFQIVTALSAFLIGYAAARWVSNENSIQNAFLFIGILYVAVGMVALLKVAPALFPMVESIGNRNGVLVSRPHITTPPNSQIFYLLTTISLLAAPMHRVRTPLIVLMSVAALFLIVSLQSRSGLIVFLGLTAGAILLPIQYPTLGRSKLILLPLMLAIMLAFFGNRLWQASTLIIQRFAVEDVWEFNGRLTSVAYLAESISDLKNWFVPEGNSAYGAANGGLLPHSNPSAFFVEGGVLALGPWIGIILLPVLVLGIRVALRRVDLVGILFFIGGLGALITQLYSNAILFEQVWVWAGAVIGTLYRLRLEGRNYRRPVHGVGVGIQ